MTKIIKFDPSWRQRERAETVTSCDHKNVIAFTASQTVQCATCGTDLDPFYVMLELLKGSSPPGEKHRELKLYNRELERRELEKSPKQK